MKKFIQKTVAGVSALAMTAALSATAVPAFADEYEAVQEADFVQSYAVGDEQLVAEYLLDLGFSIDETTELMNLYQQGETNNEVVAYASSGSKYYNENKPWGNHYLAFIATNPKRLKGTATMTVEGNLEQITDFTDVSTAFTYNGYVGSCTIDDAYYDADDVAESEKVYRNFTFSNLKYNPATESKVFGTAFIHCTGKARSEAELRQKINYEYLISSTASLIKVETYIRADLNRDGSIDSTDWNAIATYMARLNKNADNADEALDFGFDDVIAPIDLAKLSADINCDGRLDDQDVILYSKVAAGQVEL